MNPVATADLERLHIRGASDDTIHWDGAFVAHGEHGTTQSTTIVFEIAAGCRLGWHTDQTEETQYILAGTGELQTDEGNFPVAPGSVFVLPTDVRHDLVNTGTEEMRAVAFFAAAMFTQHFEDELLPGNVRVIGTPNRNG